MAVQCCRKAVDSLPRVHASRAAGPHDCQLGLAAARGRQVRVLPRAPPSIEAARFGGALASSGRGRKRPTWQDAASPQAATGWGAACEKPGYDASRATPSASVRGTTYDACRLRVGRGPPPLAGWPPTGGPDADQPGVARAGGGQ